MKHESQTKPYFHRNYYTPNIIKYRLLHSSPLQYITYLSGIIYCSMLNIHKYQCENLLQKSGDRIIGDKYFDFVLSFLFNFFF